MGASCEPCCSSNGRVGETDANTMESPPKKTKTRNINTANDIAGSSTQYNNNNKNRKESVSSKSYPIDVNDSDFISDGDYPPTEDVSTTYNNSEDDENDEESAEKIINGFKNAVQNGNDSLVMQLVEEYPSLELLELTFENGDNALHVAVRNSAHNLILYLLTNGVSV